MKRLLGLFAAAVLVSGCATTSGKLVHYPPKTQEEFNHDSYDCRCTNMATTRQIPSNTPPLILLDALFSVEENAYRECMQQKYGYKLVTEEMEFFESGMAAYGQGDFSKAITDYTRCLKKNAKNADAYFNRALCYIEIKEYDKAWADVTMYKKLGGTPEPEFVEALDTACKEASRKESGLGRDLKNMLSDENLIYGY